MTATSRMTPAAWTAARGRAWLWLAALVMVAAALAAGGSATPLRAKAGGGAVLERPAVDLAILRQSEAPILERRGAADDRAGGADDPRAAMPSRCLAEAPGAVAPTRPLLSAAPHGSGTRLRPAARAPPAA